MIKSTQTLPPNLEMALRDVAKACRRRVRARNLARFGLATMASVLVFTLLMYFAGKGLLLLFIPIELALVWYWLLNPAKTHLSSEQVALYIDEHHPELENRIVSAVEFSQKEHADASQWFIEQFLSESDIVIRQTALGDLFDLRQARRLGLAAVILVCLSVVLTLVFSNLWIPAIHLDERTVPELRVGYRFTVEPGNASIRRGEDVIVLAKSNEAGKEAAIQWRSDGGAWQIESMKTGKTTAAYFHQFYRIRHDFEYKVQFGEVSSEVFHIDTWTPPNTEAINLTMYYPEYLGLENEEMPNSGTITAPEGSVVDIEIEVNKKVDVAALVFSDGTQLALEEQSDAFWKGTLNVTADSSYHVELLDAEARPSEFNPEYTITALADKSPRVRIEFPLGDGAVTSLEEVPFDFEVSDDFGVDSYGIQFEVAGRPPIRHTLGGEAESLASENIQLASLTDSETTTRGSHLLYLEDMALDVGDLVTWTVWAKDRKPGRSVYEELGDPYFLEIRPFRMQYEESVSDQSGGEQPSGGQSDGGASSQKDIIIATWQLRRKAGGLDEEQFSAERDLIVAEQEKLAAEMQENVGGSMEDQRKVLQAMSAAVAALHRAVLPEPGEALSEATNHEQDAYRLILKMQPDKESIQRSQSQQGAGGGGGDRQQINELELDRNRNFYEEERRAQAEQEATEDILNKLDELTQRQEMNNEEIADLISELKQDLNEEERREAERRLERLQDVLRENLDQLDEISRDIASNEVDENQAREAQQGLSQGREEMNRTLENLQRGQLQQAQASGAQAEEALSETQRKLEQTSTASASRQLANLSERLEELKKKQASILDKVRELDKEDASATLDAFDALEEKKEDLLEQKSEALEDFEGLLDDFGGLAENTQASQPMLSRELNDWLRETSREGISDEMRNGSPLIKYGLWEPVYEIEEEIKRKLDETAANLREVEDFLVEDDLSALRMALNELEDVLDEERPQGSGSPGDPGSEEEANLGPQREGSNPGQSAGSAGEESEPGTGAAEPSPPGEQTAANRGQQGGGNTPGQGEAQGDEQGEGNAQNQTGAQGGGRGGGAGGGTPGVAGPAPGGMGEFMESDYQQWLEGIRNAEGLLNGESDFGGRLTRVREALEGMRRDYRTRGVPPQFEYFLDKVVDPLADTAEDIKASIRSLEDKEEFTVVRHNDVPAQYEKRVADYFKELSELERGLHKDVE
jgi:hypothetical protein